MYVSIFRLPETLNRQDFADANYGRSWRNSGHLCAFADHERHLGHVVKTNQWHAWDATHSDETSTSFKYLGSFAGLEAAMEAVESAVTQGHTRKTMRATGGFTE
jgi:hypothetical protein